MSRGRRRSHCLPLIFRHEDSGALNLSMYASMSRARSSISS